MKKIILAALFFTVIFGCKKENTEIPETQHKSDIVAIANDFEENAVIYEANIRQYSTEGTFNAFTSDIPNLKKMGVKVLWLMPIHEIGIEKRKAKTDTLVDQIVDLNEKQKYLGNPYAVKDYRSINSDFGTKEDFIKLIKTAHKNGIYVVLDWVANHTAWDHKWTKERQEYYSKDQNGNLVSPFDWNDVVKLDYNNKGLRKAMIEEMKYWITEFNVDGFRCDVAAEVPADFWKQATNELQKIKPVFMLAEAEKSELTKNGFNAQYGWEAHYIFNGIAQGKKTAKDWDDYLVKTTDLNQKENIRMNFTSNHAENFWNGTEYERMGDAAEVFAALTFATPGIPLIYNGQEYDSNKRLKLYEKDTITHTIGKMMMVYEKLGKLKAENPALNGGKTPASYKRLITSADTEIVAFEREKSGKKIIFIANLSKKPKQFTLPIEGSFLDYMSDESVTFTKDQKMDFKPWEYKVLIVQ
ncbi:alpha-amylase family glycosyl hydrolase [Flavobacterium sp.]|uniref:alpha-amylase family glycosyl hydrolase n=1 Tax=Flavobacterium sp. TaxID=239 RepID=UPI002621B3FC|nr:alpha-amylase family glycosyl hydrolase [Flavobacterium sp.]